MSLGLLLGAFPVHAAATAISISTVSPATATPNAPVTLSATVSSSAGSITSCNLYVDNDDKGAMSVTYGTASMSYTFYNSQIYTVYVFCRDSAGNFNSGPNTAVWSKGASGSGSGSGSDVVPPSLGSVSPAAATAGSPVNFTVNVTDASGVASCDLYVGGVDQGVMTLANGTASKSYTFTSAGPYAVYASCKDLSNNVGTSASTAISVSPSTGPSGPAAGSLIKLACPAGAASDNPCKVVYYYGKDGKRHSFPSEKVFFTWFADFNTVQTVTSDMMASFALGKNVSYRPGSRMVKFTSVPMVYAIAKGGVLRWVKTEADAVALYGTDWNKKIDDISEAFFMDYKYGTDITSSDPFNVQTELNSAPTIDDNL